jgi:hypothetical protein
MVMKTLYFVLILWSVTFSGRGDKLQAEGIDVYTRTLQTERSRTYDAIHYRIKLRFDEDKGMFWGQTTITLRPLRDGFDKCSFDAEACVVSTVTDQNDRALEFSQGDGKI